MNKTFNEIYEQFTYETPVPGKADFWRQWKATEFGKELTPASNPELGEDFMKKIFQMLQARYGNSTIVGETTTQWALRLFLIIYEYAPGYQKKYDVQKKLRTLTEENGLLTGAIQKTTHGYNPSTDISGNTDTEITTVNDQNLMKYTKGKLNAYNELMMLLKSDVTEQFISKFKVLFIKTPLKNYWEVQDE